MKPFAWVLVLLLPFNACTSRITVYSTAESKVFVRERNDGYAARARPIGDAGPDRPARYRIAWGGAIKPEVIAISGDHVTSDRLYLGSTEFTIRWYSSQDFGRYAADIAAGRIRQGMPMEALRLSWGDPDERGRSVYGTSDVTTWFYKDYDRYLGSTVVYFHDGVVVGWSE